MDTLGLVFLCLGLPIVLTLCFVGGMWAVDKIVIKGEVSE